MLHGKEIYIFFCNYKLCGMLGIIISSSIISFLINRVFRIINENKKIENYNDFLKYIFVKKRRKINLVNSFNYIINIFLLMSYYVMVAGFCAYFKQQYDIPVYICAILVNIIGYMVLSKNIEGVIKISVFLVPIIVSFIINMGINNFQDGFNKIIEMKIITHILPQSVISSILYASYNSILLLPVVVSLKKYVKKDYIFITSSITWILLIILGTLLYIILLRWENVINNTDMPIMYTVKNIGKGYEYLYGIVIVISIFTSMISSGYSFLKNCCKDNKHYKKYLWIICLSSMLVCNIGFSNLVNLLYPVFGLLGIFQIYFILNYNLRHITNNARYILFH